MNKNKKTLIAVAVIAAINLAIYPLFEIHDAISACIQGVLFSFPALIVDVIPSLSARRSPGVAATRAPEDLSTARIVCWTIAAYGMLSLVQGIVAFVDVAHVKRAVDGCSMSLVNNCDWLAANRAAADGIENNLDMVPVLATVLVAALAVIAMLTHWIANRSDRPLQHVTVGAAIFSLLRAIDSTLTHAFSTSQAVTPGALTLRFILSWIFVFIFCMAIGLLVTFVTVRPWSRLVREMRSARKRGDAGIPPRIHRALSAKIPGHEVRVRERQPGPLAGESSGFASRQQAALRNWSFALVSIALAAAVAIAIAFATERYITGVPQETEMKYPTMVLLLIVGCCWPLYCAARRWLDPPQWRFERAWSRHASTAEALLLLIAAVSWSAAVSVAVIGYVAGYQAELTSQCAGSATLDCQRMSMLFDGYEYEAGDAAETGTFFVLLFLVGARFGTQLRWIPGALVILLPMIAVSITRGIDVIQSLGSMSYTQLAFMAIGARVMPFLLGMIASKVARGYEMSRDQAVARELLSSKPFSRRIGDALLQSLGLDPARYELAARPVARADG